MGMLTYAAGGMSYLLHQNVQAMYMSLIESLYKNATRLTILLSLIQWVLECRRTRMTNDSPEKKRVWSPYIFELSTICFVSIRTRVTREVGECKQANVP